MHVENIFFIDIWFVKENIKKWLKTKICSFLWLIWKWKEKGTKKNWPSPTGIWTPDFWTNSCPKFEFLWRLDPSSSWFLELLDFTFRTSSRSKPKRPLFPEMINHNQSPKVTKKKIWDGQSFWLGPFLEKKPFVSTLVDFTK